MVRYDHLECALEYPSHHLEPEDFLHFVELDQFTDDWESLGLDVESDLWKLQIGIMANPTGGDVISGTGGLRKIRFGLEEGKRKGARVCYVYFPNHFLVLLVMAFGKSEKPDLDSDDKRGIAEYIRQIKNYLDRTNEK